MGLMKFAVLLLCAAVVNADDLLDAIKLGRPFFNPLNPIETSPAPTPPPPPPPARGLEVELSANVKEGNLEASLTAEQTMPLATPAETAPPPVPAPTPASTSAPTAPPADTGASTPGTKDRGARIFERLIPAGILNAQGGQTLAPPPPPPPPPAPGADLNVQLSAAVKEGELAASTDVVAG